MRVVLIMALLLMPVFARAADCPVPAKATAARALKDPTALAKADPSQPLWVGPAKLDGDDRVKGFGPALKVLHLKPGSVVSGVDLAGADLSGWAAEGVTFLQVDLNHARLTGARLAQACFDHGAMTGAVMNGANLRGAVFDGTELPAVQFKGADLHDAKLGCGVGMVGEGCFGFEEMTPIDFTGADLTGAAVAEPISVFGAVLKDAVIERTVLIYDDGLPALLDGARLGSALLGPPFAREGKSQAFNAAALARLKVITGGKGLALFDYPARGPSYGCGGSLSPVERAICDRPPLAALDSLMAASFRRLAASDKAGQLAFLRQRNACPAADEECIRIAYTARLGALALLPGALPAAGVTATAEPAALKPAFRDDPTARLALAAYGTGVDTATLKREGGNWTFAAEAIGANGHVCSFDGPLHQDPKTGFWLGADSPTMQWLVLPDGITPAGPYDEGREFCGMRAGWPDAYRVFGTP